jgi:hypothetical protein
VVVVNGHVLLLKLVGRGVEYIIVKQIPDTTSPPANASIGDYYQKCLDWDIRVFLLNSTREEAMINLLSGCLVWTRGEFPRGQVNCLRRSSMEANMEPSTK